MSERRGGFTLIEVLVVLVIASIVFAVLITVLGSSFEILRAGESKAKLNANARTTIDYIAEDLRNAAYIPLSSDRDLNGWPDESETGLGYDLDATWRVAQEINNIPYVDASFWLSEAWSDRLQTRHFNSAFGGFSIASESRSVPRVIARGGQNRAAQWISFYRVALPADGKMPYYLAMESDINGDGVIDPVNTGVIGGVLPDYPTVVAVGPHKETAVAIQDIFYAFEGETEFQRVRQIPISSNITRLRFEYFHEVPVYQSRVNGGNMEIAYQSLEDGTIAWIQPNDQLSGAMTDHVPLLSHWEQRIIDVAYNGSNTGGFWTDGPTGAQYGLMAYRLSDQYPERYDAAKLPGLQGWNATAFYEIDSTGDDIGDNAPVDRFGFVSTGLSGGQVIEGGIAEMRPDMDALHGIDYYNYSINPTNIGDFGDADGIPDGDGQPDDPVPGWWLPYLRNIRVTVVSTPTSIIEQRTARSGQAGKLGTTVYYRLDSPVPFADANRTIPLYNQKQDYIGSGSDLVLTKTVPVNFAYELEPVTDPRSSIIGQAQARRAELNYFNAASRLRRDPVGFSSQIVPLTPSEKLYQKDPSLID